MNKEMVTCYIGVGSNMGDRRMYIDKAIERLKATSGVELRRVSTIYETEPVGDIPQGMFLNGVIEVGTNMSPKAFMRELRGIEDGLGRKRVLRNGPRTIDLDILYYGDARIDEEDLVIPHPRIGEREFVLKGLRELGMDRGAVK
jgi:2-amino-4-hydroxy-6-hydroxymethyldihydropteridine diphosphokinase